MTSEDPTPEGEGGLAVIDSDATGYDEIVLDIGDGHGDTPAAGRDAYADLDDAVDRDEEPLPPAEAYEAFEGLLWAYALATIRQEAAEALFPLEEAVRDGRRPAPEQVRTARSALQEAESLVEEYYAPLAAGEATRRP